MTFTSISSATSRAIVYTAALLFGAVSVQAAPVFNLEPALEGGAPAITVSGLDEGAELTWLVRTNGGAEAVELHRDTHPAGVFILPGVESDTFVRVDAWEGANTEGDPIFTWTTLLRPFGETLFDYTGVERLPIPDDFDAFWERAKAELASIPPNFESRQLEEGHTDTALLYEAEFDSLDGVRIVVRYTVPREAFDSEGNVVKKFPALIVMPGYGAEQPPMDRTPSGFVTMSVNPRHHGPSKKYWTSPVEHLVFGIDDPETYYYRLAFMDCLRAADYLMSLPEVDETRVAAEGGSQGGLFAIALGVLEPRIACVVSNVTAFSAIPTGNKLNTRGSSTTFNRLLNEEDPERGARIARSLSYTDGANLATRLRRPVQINMGGQDPVCHFLTGIVILHSLRPDVPREFNVFPDAKHEVPGTMRAANARWVRMWLGLDDTPSFPGRVLRVEN